MPSINKIVTYLNDQLKAGVFKGNAFNPSQYSAVCITVKSKEGEGTEPYLTDDFDNLKYVGYDDIYMLQVYHKITGISHTRSRKQYGGSNDNMITDYAMQAIVTANRHKLRMTPEDLQSLFIKGLVSKIPNSEIQPLNISRVTVAPSGSDMNAFTVWRDEYNREYDLNPNQILFRIRYTIQMAYKKSCVEECCT